MPVPMEIRTSVSAYLAMRAILSVVRSHTVEPRIETAAVPGLGTGVGKLPFDIAALQMWKAYEEVALNKRFCPGDLGDAIDRHLKLNPLCRLFS